MNGGIAVDTWGRSSLPGVYAVGEAAGTHGVTRPGGAALNAGQVFGTRAAEHIAASGRAKTAPTPTSVAAAETGVAAVRAVLRPDSPLTIRSVRASVQDRMSDRAGMICDAESVGAALAEARALNADIRAEGIAYGRPAEAVRALQWQQMALASEAVLAALDHFVRHGGGSRGARAIRDSDGESLPLTGTGRSRPIGSARSATPTGGSRSWSGWMARPSTSRHGPIGRSTRGARSFFERDWPDWLTGRIFDLGERPRDR